METMTLEEAKAQLRRILEKPLPFVVRMQKFSESARFVEHGVQGQKWGVHTQRDEPPKSKSHKYEKEIKPGRAGGYWLHSTVRGKVFDSLEAAKGDWIKIADLQKHEMKSEGQQSVNYSVSAIKRWGQKTGRWSVEISGDQVRMFMASAQSSIKPQSMERLESNESKATQLAKDYMALNEKYIGKGLYIPLSESKGLFDNYYKDMGVSQSSRDNMESAVRRWTETVNEDGPQAMRRVAMDYYGRKASDEHTDGYTNKIDYGTIKSDAGEMKDAVMAMKAYAGAFAKENHITTLYRGVTGKAATAIKDAIEKDGVVRCPVNSLSSWSESKSEAKDFGTVLLKLKVDPDNIWAVHSATPWLFSAHSSEKEFIVGHQQPYEIFKKEDVEIHGY